MMTMNNSEYLEFVLESNSNKKLDALCDAIIRCIKSTGGVKSGPIPFKNKRIIYCYGPTARTIDSIMALRQPAKVKVEVNILERKS